MDHNSSTCGRAAGQATWQNDIEWLKTEVGELRRRCSLADKESDLLEKGVVELRSMYIDNNKELKGLKQIMHNSDLNDDVETESGDSYHHVIVSGGSGRGKKVRSLWRPALEGSSDSGDEFSANKVVEHLQHDVSGIGLEVEKLVSKVLPLEDVVKLLNTEVCELDMKFVKVMEDIERFKVYPLNCVDDDLHMKKKLEQDIKGWMEEKFKKLEAQIKEIEDKKTGTYLLHEINIRDSLKDMNNYVSNKINVLYQHFLQGKDRLYLKFDDQCYRFWRGKDRLHLKIDDQYRQFLQGMDRLIHKLSLHKPFVQGVLLGTGVGLLLLFLYIKYCEGSQSSKEPDLEQVHKLDSVILHEMQKMLAKSSSTDGLVSDVKEEMQQMFGKFRSTVMPDVKQEIRRFIENTYSIWSRPYHLERDKINLGTSLDGTFSWAVEEIRQLIPSRIEQLPASMTNLESKPNEGIIKKWMSSRAEQHQPSMTNMESMPKEGMIKKRISSRSTQALNSESKPPKEGIIKKWMPIEEGKSYDGYKVVACLGIVYLLFALKKLNH